jgi:hypothetical protein
MAQQLHKRFNDVQIKELIERYLKKEIARSYIQEILGIKRRRFWMLVKHYRANPDAFSVRYQRKTKPRSIPVSVEKNILKELAIDQRLIADKDVPLKRCNYSYVKTRLETVYHQRVSVPTIIKRAKKHGFYLKKKPRKDVHDREVITRYIGELIQHDTSHHLWSPPAGEKWYLITSIDDHSRFLLYAALLKQETSWAHIDALQTVFLRYGLPYSYYVDSHRIFNQYRKISLQNLHLRVNNAIPYETVNLRIYPLSPSLHEIRFWCRNKLIDVQTVKSEDLPGVHF